MKVLYCGIVSDDARFEKIYQSTKSAPFAQQKLERLMLQGIESLDEAGDYEAVSVLPVQRYPRYPQWLIKGQCDKIGRIPVHYVGFLNLPILKQLSACASFMAAVSKWAKKFRKQDRIVLLYGTNPLNVLPLLILRSFYKLKIVSYVSEVDSLRVLDQSSLLMRIKNKVFVGLSQLLTDRLDGYILVSEHMNECVNRGKKPWIVVEGMVPAVREPEPPLRKKQILYAGSLHERYGIGKLVEAFCKLPENEYQLVIYGNGDYVRKLEQVAADRMDVVYKGTAMNHVIVQEEKESTILVNPRPSAETLTRYSFPSKTFEYMLSGTPCLITRLDGIPQAYYNYCYSFSDETPEGMSEKIASILALSEASREEKARSAFCYVTKEKNNVAQMARIHNFLQKEF